MQSTQYRSLLTKWRALLTIRWALLTGYRTLQHGVTRNWRMVSMQSTQYGTPLIECAGLFWMNIGLFWLDVRGSFDRIQIFLDMSTLISSRSTYTLLKLFNRVYVDIHSLALEVYLFWQHSGLFEHTHWLHTLYCPRGVSFLTTCRAFFSFFTTCRAFFPFLTTCRAVFSFLTTCRALFSFLTACRAFST